MSNDNPYTPLLGDPGDNASGRIIKKVSREKPLAMNVFSLLFIFKGRIGRRQFLKWYISIGLISVLTMFIDTSIAFSAYVISIYFFCSLSIKRSHDLGYAGWIALLQLFPFFGWLIVLITRGFSIGEFHDNRYGKSIYKI